MKTYETDALPKFDKRPGSVGTFVHGENLTLTVWTVKKDTILASHSHSHEQISYLVSGAMRFETEDGKTVLLKGGSFAVFAPNETHGGIALEDTVAIDAFTPAREDFKAETGWKDS
ncbi:MAG: cupin domain-containing protein [Synergistaceae bacterium]|nr:cupin domain-containing protein [Synergistaceae bacterium]